MHEVEHARSDAARDAALNGPSKQAWLDHMYDEETSAVTKEIDFSREQRAAGQNIPEGPTETDYRIAYDKGRSNNLRNVDEYRAAYDAARDAALPPGSQTDETGYADFVGREAGEAKLKELYPSDSPIWKEADAAGRATGRAEIRRQFVDGTLKPSGTHGKNSYGELYGEMYDDNLASTAGS
jgi:hypothetical protein